MPFIALIIAAAVVAVDQIIKISVVNNIKPAGTVDVIPGVFKLSYVENRGVAFGMFQDNRWIFVVLTSLMIIAIILYMFIKRPQGKLFYVLAGLIIGGGIGNLIDRILYGYVIDYLSLSFFPPVSPSKIIGFVVTSMISSIVRKRLDRSTSSISGFPREMESHREETHMASN